MEAEVAQKQCQRSALDCFFCSRVKLRLCGATLRQATGDYNGIYATLAYELRGAPSSTSLMPLLNPVFSFFGAFPPNISSRLPLPSHTPRFVLLPIAPSRPTFSTIYVVRHSIQIRLSARCRGSPRTLPNCTV